MSYLRYVIFIIAIIVGAYIGVYYGQVVDPVELVDTVPDTLRSDYKTDFVLMVAEAYAVDGDAFLARERLGIFLGDKPPVEIVNDAMIFAVDVGYSAADLILLRDLYNAMETWDPALEGSGP